MRIVEQLFLNAAFLLIARVLDKAARATVLILVARYLDVQSFGQYSLAIYVGFLCLVLFDFGIQPYLVREVSASPAEAGSYYINGVAVRAVYVAIALLGVVFAARALNYENTTEQCILVLVASRVLSALASHNHALFRAHNRTEYEMYSFFIEGITLLAATLAAMAFSASVVVLCLAWLAAALAGALASTSFLLRRVLPLGSYRGQISLPRMWRMAQGAFWFGVVSVCAALYTYGASFFLSKLDSVVAVGLYAAAYNVVFLLVLVPQTFVDGLFPLVSHQHQAGTQPLDATLIQATRYLALAMIPLAVLASSLATPLIRLIYGEQYGPGPTGWGSGDTLRWLGWYAALLCFAYLFGNILWAVRQHRFLAYAAVISLGLSVVLNLLLIPPYSLVGAAAALLLTFVVLCGLQLGCLSRFVGFRSLAAAVLPAVCAGVVMWLALVVVRERASLGPSAAIGLAVYLFVLLLLGALRREDLQRMRAAAAGLLVRPQAERQ